MSRLTSNKIIDGQTEAERVERFCGSFVETDNRMRALRLSFVVDEKKGFQKLMEQANTLLRDPDVQDRIAAMREEAAAKTVVGMRQILQDLQDIATADPNEIMSVEIDCCRFCNGIEHQYQWADDNEYQTALARAIEAQAQFASGGHAKDKNGDGPVMSPQLPTDTGGYGYSPHNEPCYTCPSCYGRGMQQAVFHDTRKLSPQARKLYAGVKQTKDGFEVKIHDQMKAKELVGKIAGVFKADGLPALPARAAEAVKPVSVVDAQAAYLKLIG